MKYSGEKYFINSKILGHQWLFVIVICTGKGPSHSVFLVLHVNPLSISVLYSE